MRTFALKKLEVAAGRVKFYQIVIDNEDITKEFKEKLKNNKALESQYKRIFAIISMLSNEERVSGDLNHPMKDSTPGGSEHEITTDGLRAYYFKHTDGKVIVHFGLKKTQKQDIETFRNLKREFLQTLSK
ncbi:hypothetical protein EXU85_22520 [Spirosoma sp. KCTC 42546]|uniref:hypothetical protein n=1 Tax=Spirosoma sp. KCTC 42546 TaxID=2520506 RepID=UPI00115B5BF1|nr:hypothetical protein [Spirosoma sp. KCTC 42546]QDK81231.1 hypothetical protein EXU85_22520 [Spirosoma sp. KCTC 42546]